MSELAQLWALGPLLVGAALWRWRGRRGRPAVEAALEAAAIFAAGLWVASNLLGIFSLLQPGPLRIAWTLAGIVAAGFLWRERALRLSWPRPRGVVEWGLGAGVLVLLALTLVRAVLAPPNTVDVLNYHLPRQLMWLQQGSLEPFTTVNDRQNMMPPLAEVIGLQFLALTGGDRWANLPQWSAYAGLALALALLARRLGAARSTSALAALLGLLLPMAYHEATNAKNDLLSAFWILCGAVQLARWQRADFAATRRAALGLALPLTLAWLTKSTAMLFVSALLAGGLWAWGRRTPGREALRVLAPAALLTLLLIAPFHARNLAWYGRPLGEHRAEDGGALAAEAFGPRVFASGVLRHASVHLVSPSPGWNARWLGFVQRMHRRLGVDPEDRRTTLWILPFRVDYAPDDESTAGAPFHFLLGVPALLYLGVARGPAARRVRWLAVAVLAGGGLFVALLKWQPWAARLELPLFALGTVAVVVAAEEWLGRARRIAAAAAVALGAAAWLPGADTATRPLWHHPTLAELPRELNYYRVNVPRALRDSALAELVERSGARRVSIYSVHDTPYPFMRRLQEAVPNLSFAGAPARGGAPADAVAVLVIGAPLPLYAEHEGRRDWRLVGDGFGDGLYLPVARVRELQWWGRLPAFCGWTQQSGLPRSDWEMPGFGRSVAREMPAGAAEIGYDALGKPLRLRGAVRRTAAARGPLQLTFAAQGRDFAVVDCGMLDTVEFEVVVPSTPGPHRLQLRDTVEARGGYVFTRLQLNDAP